ncbi:MAG: NUDIX hydrolase [Candidatus Omnitrophica bacterium]|nr:NUDIX hydrolase [Candidatus Omnitrophota bacterium]
MRGLKQVSAGGVVFKKSPDGLKICLIGRRRNNQIVWCLPKGHIEKDESLEQTALREVKEETGISGSSVSPLGYIHYSFFDLESKRYVFKIVHFFLIRYQKGRLADHDDEVELARWHSLEEAIRRAQYPSERAILRKAAKKLRQYK